MAVVATLLEAPDGATKIMTALIKALFYGTVMWWPLLAGLQGLEGGHLRLRDQRDRRSELLLGGDSEREQERRGHLLSTVSLWYKILLFLIFSL